MNKKTFIVGPPDISIKFDGNGDLVLFLHGIGGNKNNWDKNLSYISKSFLCVACDIRGYGESDDYIGPLNFLDVNNIIVEAQKKKINTIGDLDNIVKMKLRGSEKTLLIAIYNNENQRRYIGVKLN